MFYLNEEDRQREALAKNGTIALATIAGWQTEPCANVLPPVLAGYDYCRGPDLVLAHWRRNVSLGRLLAAVRETRLDLLLVEPAWIGTAADFRISAILCREGDTHVFRGLRLWAADINGPNWLIPDPSDRDLDPRCFDLAMKRMTPDEQVPFSDPETRDLGLLVGGIRWKAMAGGHLI
ncbi:hypothetical protein [Sphingobium fuliginis]|uniref:Uncharacterized protein n=1 Tax=Sphingobium fuliginis (strain ATCC 27551) TaxID=336203 RepID=A0ABQ1EZ37_SPHSA|nr:hypothetical protein [Sphingobium fuliginis]RYL97627.1 hypothetical protein EWH10_13865 [Sphingobium fuliginis]GFZ94140.1 hypothetical protein GCM10019071_25520 [Sphingobium fuliginis]